jgi:gliding motility-associated-like protein
MSCGYGLPNFIESYFKDSLPTPQCPANLFSFTTNCSTQVLFSAPVGYQNEQNVSYQWNFGDVSSSPLNFDSGINPSHSFSSSGTYTVTLIVAFCNVSDTIEQTVVVTICQTEGPVIVPGLYENIDGIWQFEMADNNTIQHISIYDLLGNLVASHSPVDNSTQWDGRNTNGEKCAAGMYFYIIEYTNFEGKDLILKRPLVLVK